MTPQEWEDWTEALAFFYVAWFGTEGTPTPLSNSLLSAFGADFKPDVVYPVGEMYEDGRVSLLAIRDDEAILIRFEPPSTTTASYLGSLAGGTYRETRDVSRDDAYQVTGEFSHDRLDDPIRINFRPVPAAAPGSGEALYLKVGHKQALAVFDRVREAFRRWATENPR